MTAQEVRFEFGKNWQDFLSSHLNRERIEITKRGILAFTGRDNLEGMRILDIGCGSGLHSLAMFEAGAKELVSLDYDPNSVAATRQLWQMAGSPDTWRVLQGSVLDHAFMSSLGQYDLVYCWGVMHHTGDVWTALDNASRAVSPKGLFYLALYDSDAYPEPPEFWLRLKPAYVAAGPLRRRLYELWYLYAKILRGNLLKLPYVLSLAREYKFSRGMALYTDIKDWLGGWPMEFTRIYEVIPRLHRHSLSVLRIRTGEGNTEYLAGGPDAPSTSDTVPLSSPVSWDVTSLRNDADLATLDPRKPIYIYGTGRGGDLLYDAVTRVLNTTPAGFVTTSESGTHRNLPVLKVAELSTSAPKGAQVLVASSHFGAISIRLAEHGILRFWNAYPYAINA